MNNIDELYGRYFVKYSFGSEQLILNVDGTYSQTVTITTTGKTLNKTGKWSYDVKNERITLEGMYVVNDALGKLLSDYDKIKDGICSLTVERSLLSHRLRLGSVEGSPYIKMDK